VRRCSHDLLLVLGVQRVEGEVAKRDRSAVGDPGSAVGSIGPIPGSSRVKQLARGFRCGPGRLRADFLVCSAETSVRARGVLADVECGVMSVSDEVT